MGNRSVTIVGAGPSGLSLAWWLTEAGVPVTVLEQEPELPRDMRASTFHPATLDLLAASGIAEELVARGTVVDRWQYLIHTTGETAVFDMACLNEETAHPYRLQCEQFQLTGILAERLRKQPLCQLEFDATFLSLEQHQNSVAYRYKQGALEKSGSADWLLAADGAHSPVRKQLGAAFTGQAFAKTSITLILEYPFEDIIPGLLGVNYVWLPDRHYSLMRLRDTWRFTYSPDQGQEVATALSDDVARSNIARISAKAATTPIRGRNHYTLHQRCMDSFCHGRVVFLGDAAHLNSPAGGMGMNSGIHDAYSLAQHLIPVLQGENSVLMDRYNRRRRTVAIEEVQRLSARNYARHREVEAGQRKRIWKELQATVNDPVSHKNFLMEASMIRSLQRERAID